MKIGLTFKHFFVVENKRIKLDLLCVKTTSHWTNTVKQVPV